MPFRLSDTVLMLGTENAVLFGQNQMNRKYFAMMKWYFLRQIMIVDIVYRMKAHKIHTILTWITMCIVFWDRKSVLLVDFLPRDRWNVNAEIYCKTLSENYVTQFKIEINHGVILLQENVGLHIANSKRDLISFDRQHSPTVKMLRSRTTNCFCIWSNP